MQWTLSRCRAWLASFVVVIHPTLLFSSFNCVQCLCQTNLENTRWTPLVKRLTWQPFVRLFTFNKLVNLRRCADLRPADGQELKDLRLWASKDNESPVCPAVETYNLLCYAIHWSSPHHWSMAESERTKEWAQFSTFDWGPPTLN